MRWLFSLVRVVGASLPFAPSLVQLQAEIDSRAVQARLHALEDPISSLHPDVRRVSELLYQEICSTRSNKIRFDAPFYAQFSRPLAILEAHGYIKGAHAFGKRFADGILWVQEPNYFVYLCALFENQPKMDQLIQSMENCKPGQWLDGEAIATSLQLPLPTVQAIFLLYESKGLGTCSRTVGATRYLGVA